MEKMIFSTAKADGKRLEKVTARHEQLWRCYVIWPAFSPVENKPGTGKVGIELVAFGELLNDILSLLPLPLLDKSCSGPTSLCMWA